MRRFVLLTCMALTACGGTAPAVQPPPDLGINTPCMGNNAPPPGYKGPVSPYAGSCAPAWDVAPKPAGVHDYSQGQPPRAVRGQ
ncbi:MAG: hypothetical protein H7Z12_14025 [Rhodospirillaceae bacterium]|nr:hypothetical protein [Rhodospirillales bacterium]